MALATPEVVSAITIALAAYTDSRHAADMLALMDEYSRHPFGGGVPLPDRCRAELPAKLAAFPGAFSVLAYSGDQAVGLVNCFTGFSTFACQPLVNIHDVIVSERLRGKGLCAEMLDLVAREAKRRGCCKMTMEVLEKNHTAQHAYRKAGFKPYTLDEEFGQAEFWQRYL
ncbi:GNAT family N-acetyltransferase [Microbulbifer sp. 2205BS26-8]|uniref:GNAT family N-acetyltransferase n=1 Tax=Microbulbifer sp. 2205BS26-8 TaxID=3064386 RepID=UPI00273F6701|nr:GNAT family N-acetyltransferase [Microbulbifer sp. 2205BS26-8]MDP5210185.1 GNAT family N-acetyltransferase [Microbulbifer sp. 2205BS26-8]